MTVSDCLREWLSEFDRADFTDILTDFLKDVPEDCLAIFKSPNKTEKDFQDGSKEVTEYYQFYFTTNVEDNRDRISNQQLLTDLEEWVEERDMNEDYPDLSKAGNYICLEIKVNMSGGISSVRDNGNGIYQVTIGITYLKER